MTTDYILKIAPDAPVSIAEQVAGLAKFYFPWNAIDNPNRIAAFMSQLAHESQQFNRLTENLNYSAAGLLAVFPAYFNANTAAQYERNPVAIANRVYANRNQNGPESSGDGWRFRGRGFIQLTFKENYRTMSKILYNDENVLLTNPEKLETVDNALLSSLIFWNVKKLSPYADAGNLLKISQVITGSTSNEPNGWSDRVLLYNRAKQYLSYLQEKEDVLLAWWQRVFNW